MHCWTHRSHPYITLVTCIAGPTGHTHTSHASLDPQVTPTHHTRHMHCWTHRSHPHTTLVTCFAGPTGHTHTSHSPHAWLDPQVTPTRHTRHMHCWTHRSHSHVTPTHHTRHMHCWTNRSHPCHTNCHTPVTCHTHKQPFCSTLVVKKYSRHTTDYFLITDVNATDGKPYMQVLLTSTISLREAYMHRHCAFLPVSSLFLLRAGERGGVSLTSSQPHCASRYPRGKTSPSLS